MMIHQFRASSPSYTKEQALVDLTRAENKPADAIDNFKVISDCQKQDEGLKEATDGFLRLLSHHGNNDTGNVQSYYRTVNQAIRPGESRSQATDSWLAIQAAENKPEDGKSGFEVVGKALGASEPRAQGTEDFVRLLKLEGSDNTGTVQSNFLLINSSVKPGETRAQAIDQFERQYRAENKIEDVTANYTLVDKLLRAGETREQATTDFLNLLRLEGSDSTGNVQSHYSLINSGLRADETRGFAITQFEAQWRAENKIEDAVANYKLVQESVGPNETREAVTGQFLRILSAEGNSATSDAQSAQRAINRLVSPERSRADLTDSYLRLRAEAKSPAEALSMFQLAHS